MMLTGGLATSGRWSWRGRWRRDGGVVMLHVHAGARSGIGGLNFVDVVPLLVVLFLRVCVLVVLAA
jgi:hypothetical protein